jgi:apolipoprotein N-acyltransferase
MAFSSNLHSVLSLLLGGIIIFLGSGFGFGTTGNGHFPVAAFLVIPSLLWVVMASSSFSKQWLWLAVKFVWAFLCLGLGYTFSFFGVFSKDLVFGISFFISLTVVVLVVIPFYRTFVRFEERASSGGILLLSLVFPVLYTTLFFLVFTYVSHLGDFPHPAYAYVSLRPLMVFASFQGVSGVVFVVSWAGAALWLAQSRLGARRRRLAVWTALAALALACCWGSGQALACEKSFFARPTDQFASDDVAIACFSEGLVRGGIDK